MFRGVFKVRVDDKGRLKLPATVKQRLDNRFGPDAGYFVTSLTGRSEERRVGKECRL